MRKATKEIFIAQNGTMFDTELECLRYEVTEKLYSSEVFTNDVLNAGEVSSVEVLEYITKDAVLISELLRPLVDYQRRPPQ